MEMTYDDAGRLLTRSTLRQGEAAWLLVKQAHDISGRLWRVYNPTDPTDSTYRELGYDSVGNVVSDRDESQNLVQSLYDSFSRLTEVRRHLDGSGSNYMSTTYGYGLFGSEPTSLTDGEGHQTTYERDDLFRLTKVVSPDAGTIRYVYDEASRVVDRYAADGKRSHFVYDGAGRLTWADHDYGSASAFTSDMRFTFDSATGCPTDKPQSSAGRLARADEQLFADSSLGDGVYDRIVCYYYDSLGRLVRETTLGDEGVTRHTEYEYDSNSNLVRLRYPMITNAYARWDYDLGSGDNADADEAYRVASETTKGVTYIYAAKASERYPFGPLRRIWHGNSTSTPPSDPSREVLRRLDGTVSTLRSRLGGSKTFDVLDRTYTYQPTAQIASFADALSGNPDRYYKYDAARRLTCATKISYGTCPAETNQNLLANVTYDNADNRETFREYSGVNDSYVYTAATDKLDRINHASQTTDYTNDGSGRRTYDNNLTLSDDYRNYYYRADGRLRLVSGRRPSVNPSYQTYQLAYAYDWKGRRIFKSDKNLSTGVTHQWWFYYDVSDRLIGVREIPNAASPTTYNVHVIYYLDDERVMRFVLKWVNGSFSQEQRDLVHADHLATPMELERWPTSGSPSIVWSADYDPWGYASVAGGSTAAVDHRFPGQWYDAETESRVWQSGVNTLLRAGLAQNWTREYDEWTGAFTSVDGLLTDPQYAPLHESPFGYPEPVALIDPGGQAGRGRCVLVEDPIPLSPTAVDYRCQLRWCCHYECPTVLSSWLTDAGYEEAGRITRGDHWTVVTGPSCPSPVTDPGFLRRRDFRICLPPAGL
ncbi:MAG: RHS repeat protein [Deltaproteobacteria bacterium]|nr:RHS repeat protein [Deltaproteobacteria bacterium]